MVGIVDLRVTVRTRLCPWGAPRQCKCLLWSGALPRCLSWRCQTEKGAWASPGATGSSSLRRISSPCAQRGLVSRMQRASLVPQTHLLQRVNPPSSAGLAEVRTSRHVLRALTAPPPWLFGLPHPPVTGASVPPGLWHTLPLTVTLNPHSPHSHSEI